MKIQFLFWRIYNLVPWYHLGQPRSTHTRTQDSGRCSRVPERLNIFTLMLTNIHTYKQLKGKCVGYSGGDRRGYHKTMYTLHGISSLTIFFYTNFPVRVRLNNISLPCFAWVELYYPRPHSHAGCCPPPLSLCWQRPRLSCRPRPQSWLAGCAWGWWPAWSWRPEAAGRLTGSWWRWW